MRAGDEFSVSFENIDGRFTFDYFNNFLNVPKAADTKWHHWTCTNDIATGVRKVYRDGVFLKQDKKALLNPYTGTGQMLIGGRRLGTRRDWYFKGTLDEVCIVNRVLNATEIGAVMLKGCAP